MANRGRPSMGLDCGIKVAVPTEVSAALRRMAAEHGVAQTSLIRGLLCEALKDAGFLTEDVTVRALTPAGGAYRG